MVMDRVGSIVGSGLRAGEWVGLWWSEKWGSPPFRERGGGGGGCFVQLAVSGNTWVRALDCREVFALGLAVWACSGVTWGICSVVFDL